MFAVERSTSSAVPSCSYTLPQDCRKQVGAQHGVHGRRRTCLNVAQRVLAPVVDVPASVRGDVSSSAVRTQSPSLSMDADHVRSHTAHHSTLSASKLSHIDIVSGHTSNHSSNPSSSTTSESVNDNKVGSSNGSDVNGGSTSSTNSRVSPIVDIVEDEPVAISEASGSSAGLAAFSLLGGLLLLAGGGYLFKDNIRGFLDFFIQAVDDWGPWGYVAYAGLYTALEVLAVPAIPLTMTAGVIFDPIVGTIITSLSSTVAAGIAFLIARYLARDRVRQLVAGNPRFAAIDRAIGKDGFKFVTLLRLSPLLPLAASNYIYGLTSVDLLPYMAGSFLGMLPGTYAYVSAGHVGKAVLAGAEGGGIGLQSWQIAIGLAATVGSIAFVGQLARKAIDESEAEDVAEGLLPPQEQLKNVDKQ